MLSKKSPLADQFVSLTQQQETAELGMWVFLATEVLFFGSLFLALIVYKKLYGDVFSDASRHLNILIGATNTFILLTSSLTMALGIQAANEKKTKSSFYYLTGTAVLGLCFLGLKAVEYHEDFTKNLFPGAHFALTNHAKIFFFLYYFMTGLHAVHLFIGICVVTVMAAKTKSANASQGYFAPLEVTGLYWHFVDIVWVFLFPFLYLSGRSL